MSIAAAEFLCVFEVAWPQLLMHAELLGLARFQLFLAKGGMASSLLEDHCLGTDFIVSMNPFHNCLRIAACGCANFGRVLARTDFVQCHPSLSGARMRCTHCLVSQYIYTLIPLLQVQFQHPVFGITLHSFQIRIPFICPKLQFSSWVGFSVLVASE